MTRFAGGLDPLERELGFIPFSVPDAFHEPLTETELEVWE
jgi:hypothetical protein